MKTKKTKESLSQVSYCKMLILLAIKCQTAQILQINFKRWKILNGNFLTLIAVHQDVIAIGQ